MLGIDKETFNHRYIHTTDSCPFWLLEFVGGSSNCGRRAQNVGAASLEPPLSRLAKLKTESEMPGHLQIGICLCLCEGIHIHNKYKHIYTYIQ